MIAPIRIADLESFRDYMFRKLGEEYFEIEVSPTQWVDILRDSINIYVDKSNGGVYQSNIMIDVNGKRSIVLPEEVMGIDEILGTSTSVFTTKVNPLVEDGSAEGINDFILGFADESVALVPDKNIYTFDGGVTADDGTEEYNLTIDENGQKLVKLPKVSDDSGSIYSPLGLDMGFSSSFFFPYMTGGGGDLSLSTYALNMSYMNTLSSMFKTSVFFDYKPETKRLVLGKSYQTILVKGEIRESPENFINDEFFKLLVEEKLLTQWSTNLALKYTSAELMGNGIDLNIERMDARLDVLRERIELGYENDEWDGLLAPIRIDG